jgi:hypothetical protein
VASGNCSSAALEAAGSGPALLASVGLDTKRFERDLDDPKLQKRVQEDLADGRRNGVRATPTIFIDGIRCDGAWDFYSMLEALKPPIAAQVKRTARAFAVQAYKTFHDGLPEKFVIDPHGS